MLGFGRNKATVQPRNGFSMGPGTGASITPEKRAARSRKLRKAFRETPEYKASKKGK